MTTAVDRILEARALLKEEQGQPVRPWGALGAAILAATAAILLAGAMILGPGVALDDAPPEIEAGL
jgi:hypothetical protein